MNIGVRQLHLPTDVLDPLGVRSKAFEASFQNQKFNPATTSRSRHFFQWALKLRSVQLHPSVVPSFVFSCGAGLIFHAVGQFQKALQLSQLGIETALQLVASRRLPDASWRTETVKK